MVVQHILCSRMGRREVKPVVPKVEPPPEKNENADKEESTDNKDATSDDPVKEEDADDTEKEAKAEDTTKDEEKSETDSVKKEDVKKEDVKKPEEPPTDSKPAETIAVVETKPQFVEVEEYFVKYRNFSYLHCEWRTEEEMYKGDKRIQAKLKRFKQKQQQNTNIFENVLNAHYLNLWT